MIIIKKINNETGELTQSLRVTRIQRVSDNHPFLENLRSFVSRLCIHVLSTGKQTYTFTHVVLQMCWKWKQISNSEERQGKWNRYSVLMGIKIDSITMQNSIESLLKLKLELLYYSGTLLYSRNYPTLDIRLKNKKHHNKQIPEHLCLL